MLSRVVLWGALIVNLLLAFVADSIIAKSILPYVFVITFIGLLVLQFSIRMQKKYCPNCSNQMTLKTERSGLGYIEFYLCNNCGTKVESDSPFWKA